MAFSVSLEANEPLHILLPLNGRKILCSGCRLSPQLAFVKIKMSLTKKNKKEKKTFFFRETPTSPWVTFRAIFAPRAIISLAGVSVRYQTPNHIIIGSQHYRELGCFA